ncbi:helix-turn-helix domain-containing protein [Phreatobacter sp. AB_2022a]|uniref:helix-turn-helix domain-containing protein n=1 Tax=Phreatobacter sp. AB_2022a TaxID=3003134 RepID=UPI002287342B|nr:helix-turn-helix domain-containing protein [Phreatobacter sp. AB_2022a]MCZ0735133.1 helix-turn-helix domain-containing protein [Phreatobacter sp. AB_2022a]
MKTICSTSGLRGDKRAQWQNVISELYAPLDIEISDAFDFTGDISRATVGPLELTRSVADGEFARRTRRHVGRESVADCIVVLVRQGPLTFTQFGRECDVASGGYTMLDLSEPFTLKHGSRTDSYFLKVAKSAFGHRIRDIEACCAVSRPGGVGVAAIGYDLIQSLGVHAETAGPQATVLADRVVDFFGMVFDIAEDGLVESSSIALSGIRRRALRHIDARLADPDLSPETVALALRISTRYLHRAFQASGVSVGRFIRTRRLVRCRDALLRVQGAPRRIAEIAERHGFRNASHFSTCFKAEFGISPGAIRPEAPDDRER